MVEQLSASAQQGALATVALCAIFRNEAADLFEWVLYHYLLGVDHIILYDNDSTDAPERVLEPFTARNIVTLKRWPGAKTESPTPQSRSLKDCKRVARRRRATWVTAFDIDEFLVLRGAASAADAACVGQQRTSSGAPTKLHAALHALKQRGVGAVIVDRLDFGTSGLRSRGGRLATLAFTERHANASEHGKPIVLVKALRRFSGFHGVKLAADWSTAHGCASHDCPFQLFHHKTRSYEECVAKARNTRLGETNWRRRVGLVECARPGYSVHDGFLANSSIVHCIANNMLRREHGAY
jgi:hypothetical protein